MKETFLNLPAEKREKFTQQAFIEFAQHNFETASINRIVKALGIARGSVYQYFDDKEQLWLYLKTYSEQKKMEYVMSVQRHDFSSFWEYYKALYIKGIDFDREAPYCSKFLYRIGFKENSRAVEKYLDDWKTQAETALTAMVEHEKGLGTFASNISTNVIVHFLIGTGYSVADYIQKHLKSTLDENLQSNAPLLENHLVAFEQMIDELILLLEKALK